MNLGGNPYYEFATIVLARDWFRDVLPLVLQLLHDFFN